MKDMYGDSNSRSVADTVPFEDGRLITRINVPKNHRNQGLGTYLLMKILGDADKEQIPLYLEVSPYGDLDRTTLIAWYERHGFKRTKRSLWLRSPK